MLGVVDVDETCGSSGSLVCRWVAQQTWGTELRADVAEWVVDRPVRVIAIIAVGLLLRWFLRRSVTRFGETLAARSEREELQAERMRKLGETPQIINGRAQQRTKTIISVLTSMVSALVWIGIALAVLGTFGISAAPLLAGAGVLGIMLGFGAQSIVADFLAGTFMLLEDQFGVGDVIDVGEVTGSVEKVSLRVTTLRDVDGTVWHVPNSEIHRVGNLSQLWSRAVLDIEVAYDTDLRKAEGIIQRVADDLWQDPTYDGGDIIDPPEVWGVERLGADGVAIRLVVKTDPAEQWVIARELRLRIKEALDEAGIEIPFPQRTIWLRQDEWVPHAERSDVETAPVRSPEPSEEMADNPEP